MTRTVRAFLNNGEGRFLARRPTDALVLGPRLHLCATTDPDALDVAWVAGNRMDPDHPWPSDVRSLSVGDVLVIAGGEERAPRAYAIAPVGFARLDPAALVDALAFGRPDPVQP